MKNRTKSAARAASLVGIMAATVECAKLMLASIPNVEAVTLLLAVYGYVFGSLGVIAAFVFVMIEPLIWGFGSWFISYIIYWPLVALVFALLGKTKRHGIILPTALATLLTLFFGVLTSLADVGLFSGSYDNFFARFSIYYLRGVSFYVTQIITNAVVFPILFSPIVRLLKKIKERF